MPSLSRFTTFYDKKKYKSIKDIRHLGELEIIAIHPSLIRTDILKDAGYRSLSHLKKEALRRLIKDIKIPNADEVERTRVIQEFNQYVINYMKDDDDITINRLVQERGKKGKTLKSPRSLSINDQASILVQEYSDLNKFVERDGKHSDWGWQEAEDRLRKLRNLKPLYEVDDSQVPSLDELHNMFEEAKGKRRTKRRKGKKRGGSKRITDLEKSKCNDFCNNEYLKRYKTNFHQFYNKKKHLPIFNKTKKQIDDIFEGRKSQLIQDCNRNFCNPSCPNIGKNMSLRYFCPLCKKKSMGVEKKGAITYCSFDSFL